MKKILFVALSISTASACLLHAKVSPSKKQSPQAIQQYHLAKALKPTNTHTYYDAATGLNIASQPFTLSPNDLLHHLQFFITQAPQSWKNIKTQLEQNYFFIKNDGTGAVNETSLISEKDANFAATLGLARFGYAWDEGTSHYIVFYDSVLTVMQTLAKL